MLRSISIRNLAVVASADVELGPGLTVLSGETGVGKSILLDAVELVLGGRASSDLLRTGEAAATISATFDGDGQPARLSREITATGRSRAFIDGAVVPGSVLRERAAPLVEIHGQHAHLALLDPASHLGVLDAFARPASELRAVAAAWATFRDARARLARSRMDASERERRLARLFEELKEIDALNPQPGEIEELGAQRTVLVHADRIQRLCREGYDALYGQDDAAMSVLGSVWKRVAELGEIDPAFLPYAEARAAIKGQLEDLAEALRDTADRMEDAAARLESVESRLAGLERLVRKYGPTIEDTIARAERHRAEHRLLTSPEDGADALQAACDSARRDYLEAAGRLSKLRAEAAPRFALEFEALLHQLAMEHARVEVRFADRPLDEEEWSDRGIDRVELFLSANLGELPRPLARVISGGELSRAVLAVRTLSAADAEGRTLIFDEVDAGLGGRTADVVGQCLRRLSSRFQVVAVTHVPQIAAYATRQIRVRKETAGGRTLTRVDHLDEAGRREEIARMLAGSAVTPAALAAAGQLIDAARTTGAASGESKQRAKAKH
jgi:DNA repair protein RecN (Recombination protein N)